MIFTSSNYGKQWCNHIVSSVRGNHCLVGNVRQNIVVRIFKSTSTRNQVIQYTECNNQVVGKKTEVKINYHTKKKPKICCQEEKKRRRFLSILKFR